MSDGEWYWEPGHFRLYSTTTSPLLRAHVFRVARGWRARVGGRTLARASWQELVAESERIVRG